MKAILSNYRQAPRKVRLVADLVRGKRVDVALVELSKLPKRAAEPVQKLIESALSNAGGSAEDLVIKEITVDKGVTFVRYMPRARGRATPINKHSSHIKLTLGKSEK